MIFLLFTGAVLAAAVVLSKRLCDYVLTPITLFLGTWLVVAILYNADPILFRVFSFGVSPRTYWLYGVSFLAFLVGGTAHMLLYSRIPRTPADRSDIAAQNEGHLATLYSWSLWIVAGLGAGVVYKLAVVVHKYGNPLASLAQIRHDFVGGELVFPMFFNITTLLANLAILNLGVLLAYRARLPVVVLAVLTFVLAFLGDFASADKEALRLVVLLGLILYFAATLSRRVKPTVVNYAIYAGVVVAFAGLLSFITYLRGNGPDTLIGLTLRHFYLNVAGNLVSSSWFIAHPLPSLLPGGNTFAGVYALVDGVVTTLTRHGFLAAPRFGPDPNVAYHAFQQGAGAGSAAAYYAQVGIGPFNTTSYLAYVQSDFGVGGVVVVGYLLGAVSTLLFLRALRLRRSVDVQALALISVGLVMSVRGFYYGGAGFWITMTCVLFQAFALERYAGTQKARGADVLTRVPQNPAGGGEAIP